MKLTIQIELDHSDDKQQTLDLLAAIARVDGKVAVEPEIAAPRKEVQKRASVEKPVEKPAEKQEKAEKTEQKTTIEELRVLAAEKKRAGHTDQIKAILTQHGASKLSEILPWEYDEVAAKLSNL